MDSVAFGKKISGCDVSRSEMFFFLRGRDRTYASKIPNGASSSMACYLSRYVFLSYVPTQVIRISDCGHKRRHTASLCFILVDHGFIVDEEGDNATCRIRQEANETLDAILKKG
jgi:hypothetical protein